jgi:hypothetical protein
MEKWAIHFAIAFALRQVAKFHDTTDWEHVKADMDARIATALPGAWLTEEAVSAANWVIDCCAKALGEKEALQKLVDAIVAGDVDGSLAQLKALLLTAASERSGAEKLVSAVSAA